MFAFRKLVRGLANSWCFKCKEETSSRCTRCSELVCYDCAKLGPNSSYMCSKRCVDWAWLEHTHRPTTGAP